MPLLEVVTWIQAPIERVFDFARSIDAHLATTHGTQEKAVAGRTQGLIQLGETVTWEATHLGGRHRMTVRVKEFDRPYLFIDEMIQGPFLRLRHAHRFSEWNEGTLMRDELFYRAPFGILGSMVEKVYLSRYMTRFLSNRALALKKLVESGW